MSEAEQQQQPPAEQVQESTPAQEVPAEAPKAEEAVETQTAAPEGEAPAAENEQSTAEHIVDQVDAAAPESVKKTSWYKKALANVKKLVKSVNK